MIVPAQDVILALLRSERRLFSRFLLTAIGGTALTAAAIFLIREFLSGVLGGGDGLAAMVAATLGASTALWIVAGLLVLTFVGASFLQYDNQVVQQRMVKVLELGVMSRLIRHLLTLSVPFFDRQSDGDIIQAVRQDVTNLRVVVLSIARLFLNITLALGLFLTAVSLSASLTFWALIVLPISMLPIFLIARRTLARSYEVRRQGYVLFDVILQILHGIRIIKAYRGEEEETRGAIAKARGYFDALIEMVRVRSLATFVFEAFGALSVVMVIIVGGFSVMGGSLDWPSLMAFLVATRALHNPLKALTGNYLRIQQEGAAIDRIGKLLAQVPEVGEVADPLPMDRAAKTIEFDGVGYEHDGHVVLRDLSFTVEAGETLGIAGPSGSGKTTLLNLVARFYDPTEGSVRCDDYDLRRYRLDDVYGQLAIVTQEPFLFAASVRENIRCGRPDATDAEVETAATAAEIHDEILAMEQGYDTPVGPGGRGISGGQAQRINVARAILKNSSVLLLDEATSSLDSISEAKVQRGIDRLMRGRTSFVVAHRLSTLRHANRILVLDAGRCVGLGSHEDLIRDCELYRRMWETQHLGDPPRPARETPVTPLEVDEEDLLEEDDTLETPLSRV